jgi:hypothetical protein
LTHLLLTLSPRDSLPIFGPSLRFLLLLMLFCGRLDQAFIFVVSVLIAFGLSWHVYGSWIGIAINTGVAAAVAALGVREVRGLQAHFQRHRWGAAAAADMLV